MFRMKTLGNKILVTFLTLIIVQLIAYGALTYWFDARTFSEQLSNANSLTVNQMTTTLEDQIHTIENLGSQLASNAVVRETLSSPFESSETEILSLFGSFKQAWPQIDNLYLYNLARDQIRLADYDVSLPDPPIEGLRERRDEHPIRNGDLGPSPNAARGRIVHAVGQGRIRRACGMDPSGP